MSSAISWSVTLNALLLAFLGSLGTFIGAGLVVLQRRPSTASLGLLQGGCAGLMLALSFFDLLPAAITGLGFGNASLYFFLGVAFFAGITALVPSSAVSIVLPPPTNTTTTSSNKDSKDTDAAKTTRRRALLSGLLTSLGIALHNLPEGIAVYLSALKEFRLGVTVGVAIALHNIPEGLCIALPIYFATGSRWKGMYLAALSGLAEPLGVVLVGLVLPSFVNEEMVEGMLAAVAGIMVFLSLNELLPLSFEAAGKGEVNAALFVGMAVMAFLLHVLHDH